MNALQAAAAAFATEHDPRWSAVVARDAAADGRFWYSVGTTGVYCRPSCAARRARPEHVRFHATRQAAEHDGFRPCRRCAILPGDDAQALVQDLRLRFPGAELVADREPSGPLLARIAAFIAAPHKNLDLPLDARGTDFQQRVWQALRAIPAGTTASYADWRGISVHPVRCAAACAANPLAVAIPCHRVIRSDGGLSGYRWGVERKRVLLAREAHA